MDAGPTINAEAADKARQATRISGRYVLRFLQLLAGVQDGDMVHAIVFFAIMNANTTHLDASDLGDAYASTDAPPPDETRRPISVLALSQSLGMPFETTRRHVTRLIAEGACQRVKGGVIVPQDAVDTPEARAAALANLQNIRRLVRELRRVGID